MKAKNRQRVPRECDTERRVTWPAMVRFAKSRDRILKAKGLR